MKKKYILDTNIFIYEPGCLFLFEEHDLYIAPVTLRELTGLKKQPGEAGYSARRVKRILDELRANGGNFRRGIPLGDGLGKLCVIPDVDFADFIPGMSRDQNDDLILAAAAWLTHYSDDGSEVILVTDDTDMAFFADIIGVKTEHFKNKRTDKKSEYTGRCELPVTAQFFDSVFINGRTPQKSDFNSVVNLILGEDDPDDESSENSKKDTSTDKIISDNDLCENEYLRLTDPTGRSGLARVFCNSDGEKRILPISTGMADNMYPWEIYPKNEGQRFCIDALMDPDIPFVIIKGPAGTAKTFLSLACGLQQVVNDDRYKQILITRANVEMDAGYGYLPGNEEEKIGPMMRPFWDNLRSLSEKGNTRKTVKDGVTCPSMTEDLIERGYIKAESMQYMRGRSLKDTFVIIDEGQNCTPNQILSIVSRIGSGSKIVLLGDPEQIDNKILDQYNNGLVFAASRFKGSTLCAQITMKQSECVRSRLAAEAAERLR